MRSRSRAGSRLSDRRRNRIGRAYFARVLPLDDIAVRGTELAFVDLAAQHKFEEPRRHRVDSLTYDNKAGKPSTFLSTTEGQSRSRPKRVAYQPAATCWRASRWRARLKAPR